MPRKVECLYQKPDDTYRNEMIVYERVRGHWKERLKAIQNGNFCGFWANIGARIKIVSHLGTEQFIVTNAGLKRDRNKNAH